MKLTGALFLVCWLVVATTGYISNDAEEQFSSWAKQHGKSYHSMEEYHKRLAIFIENVNYIEETNSKQNSYQLGVNQFSDLTFDEFSKIYLQEPQDCSATKTQLVDRVKDLPLAIDWRDKGVITPVKNQSKCGSCWTFSTTGCLEAHHAIKTSQLISLSEQQLVDCAGAYNNHGCQGGLPSQAFEYIHYNGGLESEADYPYKAKNGLCKFTASKVAATVSKVVNITQYAEDQIETAVGLTGPVSIAYQVFTGFQHYKSGVYKSLLCSKKPDHVNHAVLAVGYNQTASGDKYWIVKNSWGAKWGNDGYFWIERGANMCGLSDCASYPVV